jgi:hypothetical protein
VKRKLIWFLPAVAVFIFAALLGAQEKHSPSPSGGKAPFSVVEATIPEMRTAMQQGRVTSHELVIQYLARIGMYENVLRATITVNPMPSKKPIGSIANAPRDRCAARCTAFRLPSKTTSSRATW